jgi:hypothetical protein
MMAFMMLFFEKKDCFDLKMFAPCSFFSEFQKKIETYSWDTLVEKKDVANNFYCCWLQQKLFVTMFSDISVLYFFVKVTCN